MYSTGDWAMRHSQSWNGLAVRVGAAIAVLCIAGCNDDEAQKAFRGAANGALQAGALSVATGVIDGAFAVFDLGAGDPNAASGG